MHRIFIGADPRQQVSLTTLIHSITANAKEPVAITPLVLETLPLKRQGLTPFTWSRFLVPYLCGFQGKALFLDADMLALGDVSEVFNAAADSSKAVYVVKDQPLFEWASMIMFNCGHQANKVLTPDFIETAKSLHSIGWVDKGDIGALPHEWNVCIPYAYPGQHYPNGYVAPKNPPPSAKLVHFTQGVPAWWETEDQPYAQAWMNYRDAAMGTTKTWFELMGRSVHAQPTFDRLKANGVVKDEDDYIEKAGLVRAE